jgi:hypothetical protein
VNAEVEIQGLRGASPNRNFARCRQRRFALSPVFCGGAVSVSPCDQAVIKTYLVIIKDA